jgi:hypothetical protein
MPYGLIACFTTAATASSASGEVTPVRSTVASSGGSRQHPREEIDMEGQEISFDSDIKPLFREKDRDSMRGAFDLWSCTDVQTHAAAIAGRLKNGSMPCDGGWPQDRIALFDRWVELGMPQ